MEIHNLSGLVHGRERFQEPLRLDRGAGYPIRLAGFVVQGLEVHGTPGEIIIPFVVG